MFIQDGKLKSIYKDILHRNFCQCFYCPYSKKYIYLGQRKQKVKNQDKSCQIKSKLQGR